MNKMTWFFGKCYEGMELECAARVTKHYKFDTFVLTGARTICKRKEWPKRSLEEYVVISEYVFINVKHMHLSWETMLADTKLLAGQYGKPTLTPVSDDVMEEMFLRQASGEFTDWRTKAVKFFSDKIGTEIKIPCGRFEGVHAVVTDIIGDNLHWSFTLFGTTTTGATKLSRVWPKDKQVYDNLGVIRLAEGIDAWLKSPEITPENNLILPSLTPFSM